jgi:hypothetical protein
MMLLLLLLLVSLLPVLLLLLPLVITATGTATAADTSAATAAHYTRTKSRPVQCCLIIAHTSATSQCAVSCPLRAPKPFLTSANKENLRQSGTCTKLNVCPLTNPPLLLLFASLFNAFALLLLLLQLLLLLRDCYCSCICREELYVKAFRRQSLSDR